MEAGKVSEDLSDWLSPMVKYPVLSQDLPADMLLMPETGNWRCLVSTKPDTDAFMGPLTLTASNERATHYRIAPTERLSIGTEALQPPCPPTFGIGTTTALNTQPSWPEMTTRDILVEDWWRTGHQLCMRTGPVSLLLETTDHTGIVSSPQEVTVHTSGPVTAKSSKWWYRTQTPWPLPWLRSPLLWIDQTDNQALKRVIWSLWSHLITLITSHCWICITVIRQ